MFWHFKTDTKHSFAFFYQPPFSRLGPMSPIIRHFEETSCKTKSHRAVAVPGTSAVGSIYVSYVLTKLISGPDMTFWVDVWALLLFDEFLVQPDAVWNEKEWWNNLTRTIFIDISIVRFFSSYVVSNRSSIKDPTKRVQQFTIFYKKERNCPYWLIALLTNLKPQGSIMGPYLLFSLGLHQKCIAPPYQFT